MGMTSSKYKIKLNKHHSYRADRPSAPGKPSLKYDTKQPADPETVTIKWDPPVYDGGSKITGYLVEHKRTGSPHWVKASPIKVRQRQLTVCGLEPGWRYQFRVSAENEFGLSDPSPLSEPLAVFVHQSAAIAPYFISELDDLLVLENDKVEFNVTVEGIPTPKISWYKDGLEIFSDRCRKISTEGCISRFVIYQVSISDESEIKCTAINKAGYSVTKAYLQVQAPPTIRLPRQYEDGLIFEQGESIRLNVSVVGQPVPDVFWYLNGEKIDYTLDQYDMEYANGTAVLKVREAKREDRGEYQVHAINRLGEDVAAILVTIANRPQPPSRINVDKVLGQTVSLSWLQPQDDGGCQIGSYIVEYYKTGWNMWLKAGTSRQPSIVLYDLIVASRYKFRVKAENPYGVSDPSPETDDVFIKDIKNNIFTPEDVIQRRTELEQLNFPPYHELEWSPFMHKSGEHFERRSSSMPPEKPKRRKIKISTANPLVNDATNSSETTPKRELSHSRILNTNKYDESRLFPSFELSTDTDNISRTSSELMLVLLPVNGEFNDHKPASSADSIQNVYSKQGVTSIPPPLSLSAPELGSEMELFRPLHRNCVSSTEILHESTIARFYKELQDQNVLDKIKKQFDSLRNPKFIGNLAESKNYPATKKKPIQESSLKKNLGKFDAVQPRYNDNNELTNRVLCENRIERRNKPWRLRDTLDNTSASSIGQYSPVSGTFHYPDLFVESLTKSPEFKNTSGPLSDVVMATTSKKPIKVCEYPEKQAPENQSQCILDGDMQGNSYTGSDLLDYEKVILNRPIKNRISEDLENDLYSKTTEEHIREDESETEESSSEETSSEEIDDDLEEFNEELENDTYHPNITPLSFEQALAISNPKRSISPTDDLFLDNENLYGDENSKANCALGYFNRNFDSGLKESAQNFGCPVADRGRKPKSILKNSGQEEDKIDSKLPPPTNPVLHRPNFGKYGLHKKQVRIEEPLGERSRLETGRYEGDSSVIVNHYSDIVRQYGTGQKPPAKVYMTYEELKAAAANEDAFVDKHFLRDTVPRGDAVEQFQMNRVGLQRVMDTVYIIPKAHLNVAQVRYQVHFFFEFFLDVVMFLSACWLYCFKDEKLAIPILFLMLYRQLYDRVKSKLDNFKLWRRKT